MRPILGCALVLGLAVGAAAGQDKDTPIDGQKLIGKWEPKEPKKGENVVLDFAKDGKLVIVVVDAGGKADKLEGSYKLSGNRLTVAVKLMDAEVKQELTVLRLTDDELQTEDAKGKKETLRRVKGK